MKLKLCTGAELLFPAMKALRDEGGGRLLSYDALPTTFLLQSVLTQAVYRQATANSRRE